MAEIHTIEIDVTGETRITVRGLKGKACKDATRRVEEALGRTTSSTPTREMHQTEVARAKH